MKRPSKKRIKSGIQKFLLSYLCAIGFFYTYAMICHKIGVPFVWSLPICYVLAILSTGGLFYFVAKSKKED